MFEAVLFTTLGLVPFLTVGFAVWAIRSGSNHIAMKVIGFLSKWVLQCIALAAFMWAALALLDLVAGPHDIDPASPFGGIPALLIYYAVLVGSVGFVIAGGAAAVFQSLIRRKGAG